MAITIRGIRLESIGITRDNETSDYKLGQSVYSLISSADKILAKQSIGGYNSDMTLQPSPETIQLLRQFTESYRRDIILTLGLEE